VLSRAKFGVLPSGGTGDLKKTAKLDQTLSELVRVSAGEPEIVRSYGTLYAHQTKIGKKIGENDLWLAATAVAVKGIVLTCDSDFLKLDPTLVSYVHFPS